MNRVNGMTCFCLLIAGLSGCSSNGAVTGTVTHQGKSVASGNVTIIASDKLAYHATINPDGTFSVPKVPTGPAKISVTSPNPGGSMRSGTDTAVRGGNDDAGPAAKKQEAAPAGWFVIPEKYADPQSSGLAATIKSPTTKIDLTLE